jgi:glycosyltransferase involved in cell wall biosynthesis
MNVLYIAYPLLPVSEESAGGAEQMLWTLEREAGQRGIATTVAAAAGSRISGELFDTGPPSDQTDDFERRNCEHQGRIIEFVRARARQGRAFDLIHDKSGSFWTRAAEVDVPILATLHLPRHFYPQHFFQDIPEHVYFNCVSGSQAHSFADLNNVLGVVRNGIALERFTPNLGPRHGLLWLGRICEEKGTHLALEIAARAGMPVTLAGQVYPFSYHQQYFEREVSPRLQQTQNASFIPSPSAAEKRQLLREAKALLIPALADETSSLVAMEAAASDTPVIAFRRGALPEVIQDGVTGFLVNGVEEAVAALSKIDQLSPRTCMQYARKNFSAGRMAEEYTQLYFRIMQESHPACEAARSSGAEC